MKLLNKIFTGILCGTLVATSASGADDCSNLKYKQAHPERCRYVSNGGNTSTYLMVGAGAAAAGAAIALLAGGANGGGSSSGGSADAYAQSYARTNTPTMIKRTNVATDVSYAQLYSALSLDKYVRNANQYDDIQLAYSFARGYNGAGSKIAVFDTRFGTVSRHAEYVMDTIMPIAPAATIEHHAIAYNPYDFMSYSEIGDIIANTNGANIYNNSWNTAQSANTLRNRAQLVNLTSQNFVNAISNAATEQDAIFVWAAGNDSNAQSGLLSAIPRVMPELNGHFVNVVAWDSDTQQLADYSNACGVTKNYCITAPGTITTSNNHSVSGTSFATPIVSAAIAVIRQAWNYLPSETITQILFDTAADLGDTGVDEIYGHGMLDLERATRPVGAPTIMINDTNSQPLQIARVSGQIAHNIQSANPTMAFFDKYGRDFETNVSDNISVHNRGIGFERLRGDDARMKFDFGDMEFGFYRNDMLSSTGFLATDGDTTTTYIGTNKSYYFGNFELFGHTQMGVARPRASEQSVISEFSNIYTASAYVGVRGNDWSLSIGMPDTVVNGTMNLHLASGRNSGGDITYQDYKIDMASIPAIEYAANWKFVTAGYVDNPYGNDEFYIFAKTKFAF